VAYVGTRGRDLLSRTNGNVMPYGVMSSGTFNGVDMSVPVNRVAVASVSNNLASFRPFNALSSIALNDFRGTSDYNSMQVTLTHTMNKDKYHSLLIARSFNAQEIAVNGKRWTEYEQPDDLALPPGQNRPYFIDSGDDNEWSNYYTESITTEYIVGVSTDTGALGGFEVRNTNLFGKLRQEARVQEAFVLHLADETLGFLGDLRHGVEDQIAGGVELEEDVHARR